MSLSYRIIVVLLLTVHINGLAHELHKQSSDSITHNYFIDIRTNLLYDALLLPNIGAEVYLGKHFSAGANWMYGWWSRDIKYIYLRAYGGELFGRWWLGNKTTRKPLSGFHVGIYGQYYLYDFELDGNGEMAGKPDCSLWKQGLFGVGFEFGYSMPIKKRLSIDFSLGIGYSGGTYHRFRAIDDHYVWQGTYRRHFTGPNKLEIALVWFIGKGSRNNVEMQSDESASRKMKKGGKNE